MILQERGDGGMRVEDGPEGYAGGKIGNYSSTLGHVNVDYDISIKAAGGGGASGWSIDALNAPAQNCMNPMTRDSFFKKCMNPRRRRNRKRMS